MQIGLDELLSMLLARVDSLALDAENHKSRFNTMFRVLYKKGIFSESDVLEAIREEHRILMELGMLKTVPDEKLLQKAADAMMLWIKGDTEAIRKSLEEYDKQMQDAMAKQSKPKIGVASAAVLDQLDRIGGNPQGGKKLIL